MSTNSEFREGCITLPVQGNHGEDHNDLLRQLQVDLTQTFGGCTATGSYGSWKDPAGQIQIEPVVRFHVAAEPSADNAHKLTNLALYYGALAKQKSVYLANFNGQVEFLTPLQNAVLAPIQTV